MYFLPDLFLSPQSQVGSLGLGRRSLSGGKMRRVLRVSTVVAILGCAPLSHACGDKLLVLGRALRFSTVASQRPASILAYAPPGSVVSEVLQEPQWAAAVEKGKHRTRVIQDLDSLVSTLHYEHYDLLLVSVTEAALLKQRMQSTASVMFTLPVLPSSPSREEARTLEKEYGIVLTSGSKGKTYLSAISKAVELRDRRAQYLAQSHKSGPLSQ